jgi:hypothetical protein
MLVRHSRTRRRLDVFHSKHTGRTFQRVTLAEVVAYFLQKSFQVVGGRKLGIDALSRKRRGLEVFDFRLKCFVCDEGSAFNAVPSMTRRISLRFIRQLQST